MKKLFTLITLLSVLTIANAQRSCDLVISQYLPGNGWEIQSGKPFDITIRVKNLGPADIKATDTILYLIKIDANYITSSGNPLGKAFYGQTIKKGDEITISLYAGLMLTHSIDGNHQFCTEMSLFNRAAADGSTDPNTANNTGCATVRMNKFSTGIDPNNVTSVLVNSIENFPNPATSETKLTYIVSQTNNVKIVVKDLQGREVMQVVNNQQNTGIYQNTIDVSTLATGVYIIEYTAGDQVITSKLVKQ